MRPNRLETVHSEPDRSRLVLELGEGVELPLTGQLKALLDSTVEAGFGDLDMMAVYLALRSRGATHLADATITSTSPTTLEH